MSLLRTFKTRNFALALAALYCHCGDNGHKMRTSFKKTCFKERSNMGVAPNFWLQYIVMVNNVIQLSNGIKNINDIHNWQRLFCSCYF